MAGPITDDPTFLTAIPFQDHVLEALHYGREHGLLKNLDVDFIAHQISTIPTTDTDGVTSDGHLACFEPPSVTPVAEGWYMPNAAATMIHRACRMPTEKEVEDLANLACHLSHAKAMKLELPALQSDNGLDYQRMCASISTRQQALVDSHRLPLEPTNLEADEGMQFPTAVRRCGPILMEQIEKETIDVSKEAFQYLANQLRVNWTDDDQRQLLSYELEYKRLPDLDRLELPVLPYIEVPEHFIPTGDACIVRIPSDTSSSVGDELKDIEERLFEEAQTVGTPNSLSSLEALHRISSSPLNEFLTSQLASRTRADDLKIEPPLFCYENAGANDQMQVDMGEVIKSLPRCDVKQNLTDEDLFDVSLKLELEEAEAKVMRSIEQESLERLDAEARIPVPIMDFSVPEPEWKRLGNDSRALFIFNRELAGGDFNLQKWPKNRRAEERMWWQPLVSGAGKISTDEQLDLDDNLVEEFLSLSSDSNAISSSDYIWDRPEAAILRDIIHEEEIEPAFSEATSPNDLMMAVREKKSLLAKSLWNDCRNPLQAPDGDRSDKTTQKRSLENVAGDAPLLADNDGMTATSLLGNFMSVHVSKKAKLVDSHLFAKSLEESNRIDNDSRDLTLTRDTAPPRPRPLPPVPRPTSKPPSDMVKIVASRSLSPDVIRGLQEAIPSLCVVQRDYSAHNTSVWYPGSVCRSEVMPALAEEVDIAISPATGLMITSMIKIHQKPLTGNSGRSGLRRLIEKASLKYERLIVLVSEGSRDDTMAAMSPSDATAFVGFQGFADTLDCSTSVYYVAGGDKALSSWAAAIICQYSQEARQLQQFLVDKETYWELFLRQSGTNTYAAQIISGVLKPPRDTIESAQSSSYGLLGFINMSPADRATRFAHILGGRRVLDRVSRIMDANWN